MGLFKKDNKHDIPIYTIENIGRKYIPINLVSHESSKFASSGFESTVKKMKDEAIELGADAIVGFRFSSGTGPMGNVSLAISYGTAVKFVEE